MLNFCDNSRFTYKRSSNTGLHNVSYKRERGFLFSGNFFSFSSGKCIGAKEKYWKFADGEGKWSREKRLLFSFNYNSTVCLPEVLVPITHVAFTRTSIIWLKRRWHKSLAEPLLNPSSFWFVNFDLR